MSYVYFNPNPSGKRVGDCVIRAISKLTNRDWQSTYLSIAMKGYELFDMPSSNNVWAEYLRQIGYKQFVISTPAHYTIRDFCIDNPVGEFMLATGTHVVTVINGDYYDAWDSGAELPIYFWARVI